MTQLPEVELLRRDLEGEVVGKRFKDVTVKTAALVGRHRNRPEFSRALAGRKIESVARRGTALVLELDEGEALVIRLGSQATVRRETATAEPGPHTQVVATFTTGGSLHYVDVDRDGELFVVGGPELASSPPLNPAGLDPLSDTFTWQTLAQRLGEQKSELKAALVDDDFLVGLGEPYSDEILWAAGLAGSRVPATLSSQEVRRLYRAVLEVVHEAVRHGGALGPVGTGEEADEEQAGDGLRVHGREGDACPRCRQPIRRGTIGGHESYHCANCQT